MRILEKIGRAGNAKNREIQAKKWNLLYGEGNWFVGYVIGDKILTREEALDQFYNKSYYEYMKKNKKVVDELCSTAAKIYNPHAKATGGVDLQCPAVLLALEKLNRQLNGKSEVAIGTWGAKYGKKYPNISYLLSPFHVPIFDNQSISVEEFWQNNKYLLLK